MVRTHVTVDQFMTWSEEIARLQVRMNAETPQDIKAGYNFGSKGIGLVRTEHMFFGPERLIEMRRFILASNHDERVQALEKIKTYQVEAVSYTHLTLPTICSV